MTGKYSYRKIAQLFFLLVLCVCAVNSSALAVVDSGLVFSQTQSTIFIDSTTGDSTLEIAYDTLSLTFGVDGRPIPDSPLTAVVYDVTFDSTKLTYVGASALDSWSLDISTPNAGQVTLNAYGNSIDPEADVPIHVLELRFRAKCQPEKSQDTITFNKSVTKAWVNNTPYNPPSGEPDNWIEGVITIPDYDATFSIPTDTVAGLFGQSVYLPLYFKSNYGFAYFTEYFTYDTSKVSWSGWERGDTLEGNIMLYVNGGSGHIRVILISGYGFMPPTGEDSVTLCYFGFNLLDNNEWDGELAAVDFDPDLDSATAAGYNNSCDGIFVDSPPMSYVNGGVYLERYAASFLAVQNSGYVYGSDTIDVDYSIQMKNRFYAGISSSYPNDTGNIAFNLLVEDTSSLNSFVCTDTDLAFIVGSPSNGRSVYEYYDAAKTNYWEPQENYREIASANVTVEVPTPTSFDDRYCTPFAFTNSHSGYTFSSKVTDLYKEITADSSNGRLTWFVQPIVTALGEFLGGDGDSTSGPEIEDTIKIRHSVPISDFEMQFCFDSTFNITHLTLASGVQIDTPSAYCRVLSAEPATQWSDTSYDGHIIAIITYRIADEDCDTNTYVQGDVTYSGFQMEDTLSTEITTYHMSSASLEALCNSTHNNNQRPASDNLPGKFALYGNFPNPFNPTTQIRFELPEPAYVTIEVFNIIGQRVTTLGERTFGAGQHSIEWNGRSSYGQSLSSGVYLYRLTADKYVATKKMLLLK